MNAINSSHEAIRADFSGLWVPLVTPFRAGSLDLPALKRLATHLAGQGLAGFVACGSTGEAAALDKAEQLAVLDTTLTAARGLPVIMGVSGYHLGSTIEWVGQLCQRPIAGLLVPAPHYIRPSQAGLLHWFRSIADASRVPVIVYDIPYRTGCAIDLATMLALAVHPQIQAIKDCGGDALKTQALIADGRLQLLAGEDAQIFNAMALGASGAIAASAHVRTQEFAGLLQLVQTGKMAQARSSWWRLLPLIQALFVEPNPAPVKTLLASQGWLCDELRPPMQSTSAMLRVELINKLPKEAQDGCA